jgi:hypothetical protein
LSPSLFLFYGVLSLYLVAVSHFVLSCLDQIRQAVETTRHSYLPEVVRQQQDAVNTERLHRFAAVVRHADDPETRRQALLTVQVMALNASPSRALGNGARLRQAAQLVERLDGLHRQLDEREQREKEQTAWLAAFRPSVPEGSGLRRRFDALFARANLPPPSPAEGWKLDVPPNIEELLAAAENNQRELRQLSLESERIWQQCEAILDDVAENMGTSACLNLDGLIGQLADQVRDLQRLTVWLLTLTLTVLLVLVFAIHRNLVLSVQACARAIGTSNAEELPESSPFREVRELVANIRTKCLGNGKP